MQYYYGQAEDGEASPLYVRTHRRGHYYSISDPHRRDGGMNRESNCRLILSCVLSIFCIVLSPCFAIPSLVCCAIAMKAGGDGNFERKWKSSQRSLCLGVCALLCGLFTLAIITGILTAATYFIEDHFRNGTKIIF